MQQFWRRDFGFWLSLFLISGLLLRLVLIFRADINWDEFFYLSHVYGHEGGTLTTVLQTFHVHFFKWLDLIAQNEVYQIFAARFVMYIVGLLTLLWIYLISRQYGSHNAALVCVTLFCIFSFTIDHGASFRADPIATSLLMGALYFVVRKSAGVRSHILAGLMIGVAGLITIKSVFYVPIFGAVFLARTLEANWRPKIIVQSALAFFVAVITFIGLFYLHKMSFPPVDISKSTNLVSHSFGKTILTFEFFPQLKVFWRALSNNLVVSFAIVAGFVYAVLKLFRGNRSEKYEQIVFISFAIPLATVIFYRNSFPYFYPFILAPACLLIMPIADWTLAQFRDKTKFMLRLQAVVVILLVQTAISASMALLRTPATQIATVSAIHQMFPEPVNYIDRNSMIASFPKQGFFMSTWGFENYLAKGEPIFEAILKDKKPLFVIGNVEALDLDVLPNNIANPTFYRLLPEDEKVLRENYIHHWGKIYVPGKHFKNLAPQSSVTFGILIDGVYTFEAAGPAELNGSSIQPGDKVFLKQGHHTMIAEETEQAAYLRFGSDLYLPTETAPAAQIYFGF